MKKADLLKFIDSDKLDERYWEQHHHELSVGDRFQIAEELRRRGLARNPDLLSEERRREDLEHHIKMSALLRKVGSSDEP